MDYDQDGIRDIISGSYDPGDIYLFRGKGNGEYAARERIFDENNLPLVHHPEEFRRYQSYLESKKPEQRDSDEAMSWWAASVGSWPAIVDWDDDGDLDFLIGSFDGQIFLRRNIGARALPKIEAQSTIIEVDGSPLKVTCHACPAIGDWDGDGLWDLIVGSGDGSVGWYRNTGSKTEPRFGQRRVLVGAKSKDKFLNQRMTAGELVRKPTVRAQVCITDYDHDGRLDLILGDYSDIEVLKKMDQKEKKDFDAIESVMKLEGEKFSKLQQDFWNKKKTFDWLQLKIKEIELAIAKDRFLKLVRKREGYMQSTHRCSHVWLYLRKSTSPPSNTQATSASSRDSSPKDNVEKRRVEFDVEINDGENDQQKVVVLNYEIKAGWHLHLNDPESDDRTIVVTLRLPEGASLSGPMNKPLALPSPQRPTENILVGTGSFEQRVDLIEGFKGEIEIVASYQVCNEKHCLPSRSFKKKIRIGK